MKMEIFRKISFSFKHSLKGFLWAIKTELNVKIAVVLFFITIVLNSYFHVNSFEWLITISSILFVLCLELMNTAIERFIDFFIKEYHYDIKIIKDMSASAVLIALLTYIIVCLITYYKYIT